MNCASSAGLRRNEPALLRHFPADHFERKLLPRRVRKHPLFRRDRSHANRIEKQLRPFAILRDVIRDRELMTLRRQQVIQREFIRCEQRSANQKKEEECFLHPHIVACSAVYTRRMNQIAERITVDPEQCGGRPCVRGMRIRVSDVVDLFAAGLTAEEILEEMPDLEAEDLQACLRLASRAPS
jgi:uncharacterized protein (DUF433 family)